MKITDSAIFQRHHDTALYQVTVKNVRLTRSLALLVGLSCLISFLWLSRPPVSIPPYVFVVLVVGMVGSVCTIDMSGFKARELKRRIGMRVNLLANWLHVSEENLLSYSLDTIAEMGQSRLLKYAGEILSSESERSTLIITGVSPHYKANILESLVNTEHLTRAQMAQLYDSLLEFTLVNSGGYEQFFKRASAIAPSAPVPLYDKC